MPTNKLPNRTRLLPHVVAFLWDLRARWLRLEFWDLKLSKRPQNHHNVKSRFLSYRSPDIGGVILLHGIIPERLDGPAVLPRGHQLHGPRNATSSNRLALSLWRPMTKCETCECAFHTSATNQNCFSLFKKHTHHGRSCIDVHNSPRQDIRKPGSIGSPLSNGLAQV